MDQAQKLVKSAVDATIKEIAKGTNPTAALSKVAADMNLNPNFIQRAGETVNVALHLSHFKTASKAEDFPIVDIPAVSAGQMAAKSKTLKEKKAAWFPTVTDIPDFRKALYNKESIKTASEHFGEREETSTPYSPAFVNKLLRDKIARLEKEYDEAVTEKAGNEIFIEGSFNNLVNYFKKEASSRESFHEFETAAYSMHGVGVRPYIDLIHTSSKTAEERGIHDQFKFASDGMSLPSVGYFFNFIKAAQRHGELENKVAYASATLNLAKSGIKAAYNQAITPQEAEACSKQADELEDMFSKEAGAMTKSIADKLLEDYKNASKSKATPVFGNSSMDNRNRALLLQELIMTDPILAHQDPKRIAEAYQQILRLAPQVAKEKEVVRSLLRQMVATQSLAPVEANQLIETNTNLLRQFELLKKTTGGGGDKK